MLSFISSKIGCLECKTFSSFKVVGRNVLHVSMAYLCMVLLSSHSRLAATFIRAVESESRSRSREDFQLEESES